MIIRIQKGQRDALKELYDLFAPGVYRLACHRLHDPKASEDIVQEVFVRIWLSAQQWDRSRGSAETWIFSVARHLIYDYMREASRHPTTLVEEALMDVADPANGVDEWISQVAFSEMLESLSYEQQRLVKLRYEEGWTWQGIAAVLGVPLGTVKSRMRRVHQELRNNLGGPGNRGHGTL